MWFRGDDLVRASSVSFCMGENTSEKILHHFVSICPSLGCLVVLPRCPIMDCYVYAPAAMLLFAHCDCAARFLEGPTEALLLQGLEAPGGCEQACRALARPIMGVSREMPPCFPESSHLRFPGLCGHWRLLHHETRARWESFNGPRRRRCSHT